MAMKLIMENWREYLKEDSLNEGIWDNIKSFFSKAKDIGSFDPEAEYPEGSYGAFAQSIELLATLKEFDQNTSKENLQKLAAGLIGASTGKEKSRLSKGAQAAAGMAAAVAGLVTLPATAAAALGAAGIGAAVLALTQAVKKDPQKYEKHPLLSKFGIDFEYLEILDDRLEETIQKEYIEKVFMWKLAESPEEVMYNINDWLQVFIKTHFDNRTVIGHGN